MPGGGIRSTWSDERVELLRKLAEDGMSMTEIATELGLSSRNQVASALRRYGIQLAHGRLSKSGAPPPLKVEKRPRVGHRPKPVLRIVNPVEVEMIPPKPSEPDSVIEQSDPVLLNDLKDDMCRWPIGDGYCGKTIARGSYCKEHAKTSYAAPKPPRKGGGGIRRSRARERWS